MQVTTALLCDFAQVREGLLFVSSGGITRLWRNEVPAPLGVFLALVVQLDNFEAERRHELEVHVVGADGEQLAKVQGSFQTAAVALEPGEHVSVPLAFDLREVRVPAAGPIECRVYLDGEHRSEVAARVQPRPE